MNLSEEWRNRFPNRLRERFTIYWHAMHPRTFSAKQLYRAGFTDAEWDALNLLRERRSECINSHVSFVYKDSAHNIHLNVVLPKEYKGLFPRATITMQDIDHDLRMELASWCATWHRYDEMDTAIVHYTRRLLEMYEHKSTNGVNTVRQLYAIWPELLPYLGERMRDTIRGTKVVAKPPGTWSKEDIEKFRTQEHMEDINYALTVMSLIPEKTDEDYPTCH